MSRWWKGLMNKVDGCDIDVTFNDKDKEKEGDTVVVEDPYVEGAPTKETFLLFAHDEPVSGVVKIKPHKKIEHKGVTVSFVGTIITNSDREDRQEFFSHTQKDAGTSEPGLLEANKEIEIPFEFGAPKPFESYRGLNATVTYQIRVAVQKKLKDISFKQEVWVHKIETEDNYDPATIEDEDPTRSAVWHKQYDFPPGHVSMEVGVDDILHIEFKYDKKRFHLRERVLGQVSFKVVQLNLLFGEVSIVKREYIGTGDCQFYETETLQKYEIMDGTPIPGEIVPIRLYLGAVKRLTPTYEMVKQCFSVKYFINLVLVTAYVFVGEMSVGRENPWEV
eukprot:NODE_1991_length_1231_cov_9.720812_g1652_i0.p1 GENE.NODE_1991_length_1231_cov_9.720812_g1652_i0~~NODE_1991_length_1231_cov_9.720812_g1652_i0.p1  ORF type:complete len:334 (+),score=91.82 NODE_1991_length_1231_cov_9.720812_g1652_i0:101-1102(+)